VVSLSNHGTSVLNGNFVAPVENRNDQRSSILIQLIKEAYTCYDIKLAYIIPELLYCIV